MNSFQILEYVAWAISIFIGLWMVIDLIRTNRTYSEDLLLSSREGDIDDSLVIDPTHQGEQR
jgi:hypothetical protein